MALISVSNNALSNITALPAGLPTGALTLIKSITASASASIEFINGTSGVVLDGTYSSYVFSFINIHTSTTASFTFNGSVDSGSNYNTTKTTTHFTPGHNEADNSTYLDYDTGKDLAQSTAFQPLGYGITTGNDESLSGYLHLFNPSSTTYVKHFIASVQYYDSSYSQNSFVAGYLNTTSAVNAVQFKMSSGNIDDGIIKLYGVS